VNPEEPLDGLIDLTAAEQVRALGLNGNGNGHGHGHGKSHDNGGHSNGDGASTDDGASASARSPRPDDQRNADMADLEWYPAYDRATVERYLATLDAERLRLEGEIADAEKRTAAAQVELAARTEQLQAALGAVVLAARAELDTIEREQQEAIAVIMAEAEAEAERVREAARLEAEAVREAASTLSALSRIEGGTDAR
jgi:hypothetical protein